MLTFYTLIYVLPAKYFFIAFILPRSKYLGSNHPYFLEWEKCYAYSIPTAYNTSILYLPGIGAFDTYIRASHA